MTDGACDCHTHVIGPRADYPMVAGRHYTPGPAPLQALQAHLARLDLQRVVIVQPSVYGTDNSCLLDALARLDGAGRGVAVLDEAVDNDTLRGLHAHGVRGVRVNLESAGERDTALALAGLRRWSQRVAALGWHVQVYAAQAVVQALAEALPRLAAPVVLDHFALAEQPPGDGGYATTLRALLASGRVYLKLSGAYRLPSPALAPAWAAALAATAPQALLWGSDWPHTGRDPGRPAHQVSAYREVPTSVLRQQLDAWLPTPALRRQVLVDNPARLYGF